MLEKKNGFLSLFWQIEHIIFCLQNNVKIFIHFCFPIHKSNTKMENNFYFYVYLYFKFVMEWIFCKLRL